MKRGFIKSFLLLTTTFFAGHSLGYAQSFMPRSTDSAKNDTIATQYDIADLFTEIFHPNKTVDPNRKSSGIIIIPNVAYNPSIGAQIGIKAIVGKILGDEPNTLMSVAASASITTKGILYFYLNHNIYTPANTYNLQGSLIAAKTVTPDFGLGIGKAGNGSAADLALSNPDRKGYVLHAEY